MPSKMSNFSSPCQQSTDIANDLALGGEVQMDFFLEKKTFWRKFSGFFENPPTLINHNFLTTEPILKVKDVLESYESESFISGI